MANEGKIFEGVVWDKIRDNMWDACVGSEAFLAFPWNG